MSQANVETVRRVYKLTEAEGVEGLLELATDDVVWISDRRFPGGQSALEAIGSRPACSSPRGWHVDKPGDERERGRCDQRQHQARLQQ